ncbi:hypothetical protein WMY93_013394 [Mugilogobius chulae]|uniref:Uncharacterized protein n=1 Tax=Mugilogobius chulae TaxID=88201 RepID=A0AAW0NZV6_9GOBI
MEPQIQPHLVLISHTTPKCRRETAMMSRLGIGGLIVEQHCHPLVALGIAFTNWLQQRATNLGERAGVCRLLWDHILVTQTAQHGPSPLPNPDMHKRGIYQPSKKPTLNSYSIPS